MNISNESIVWMIFFAPLLAAAMITIFTQRCAKTSAILSILVSLTGFLLSAYLFNQMRLGVELTSPKWLWLQMDSLNVEIGAVVDRLSLLMLMVVTGIGFAVQLYSWTYMKGDVGLSRYYACLSLFTFSMLGIVLSNNFIEIFIFWELVGLSSYLLIGFWFSKPSAAAAGNKAFIVNRIGDFGFILGILSIGLLAKTFDFQAAQAVWPTLHLAPNVYLVIGLLIFCGAVGKSAQLPLHVWLPDAMEGPTPISAFIHAATMVAAGVYMLCRVFWLLIPSPLLMTIIAWIGGITALMAALIAVTQNDIKRVLAYSTLSQLGYMIMAVGLGGPLVAMFHLTTHAFFKALLFLAAGSVMIGMHHEQNIWQFGGLRKKMPITFITFLIGTLALSGIWPLSGFYSKDEILLLAHEKNLPLMIIASATALLTAFYMGRLFILTFLGQPRENHAHEQAHESPWPVILPLSILAVLSIIAGWHQTIPNWLNPGETEPTHFTKLTVLFLSLPILGFALAAAGYLKREPNDNAVTQLGPLYTLANRKFFFDEFYGFLVTYVQGSIARACKFIDLWIIQRLIIGSIVLLTQLFSFLVRRIQTGNVRAYTFTSSIGIVLVLYWLLVK